MSQYRQNLTNKHAHYRETESTNKNFYCYLMFYNVKADKHTCGAARRVANFFPPANEKSKRPTDIEGFSLSREMNIRVVLIYSKNTDKKRAVGLRSLFEHFS